MCGRATRNGRVCSWARPTSCTNRFIDEFSFSGAQTSLSQQHCSLRRTVSFSAHPSLGQTLSQDHKAQGGSTQVNPSQCPRHCPPSGCRPGSSRGLPKQTPISHTQQQPSPWGPPYHPRQWVSLSLSLDGPKFGRSQNVP